MAGAASAAADAGATDMAEKDKLIGSALAAAACGLLGATAPRTSIAAEPESKWDIDTALLYYGESDDRVQDASLSGLAIRDFGEDRKLSLGLTVDSLTGASPSGAIASNQPQTFTTPSGRETYTTPAGEIPLDDSFLDTRYRSSMPAGRSPSRACTRSMPASAFPPNTTTSTSASTLA